MNNQGELSQRTINQEESSSTRIFRFNPKYSRSWIKHYAGETWYRFKNPNKNTNGLGDRKSITTGPLEDYKRTSDSKIRDCLYIAAYYKDMYEREENPEYKENHLENYYTYLEIAQTIRNNLVLATN